MSDRSLNEWLTYINSVHRRSIDMGLERMREVMQRLRLAPATYRVVSVAGTNGKGSSVALLEAILAESGYRTAAYTSPHLVRYEERVRINGNPVDGGQIVDAFERIECARGDTPLTYFEFGTLAALWVFETEKPDVAVMEVGMGGRLDAVNVLDADVSLITSIDVDHVEWLGADREAIAVEKAGILRARRPAVCADPNPPRALLAEARRIGARLYRLNTDFCYDTNAADGWRWRGPRGSHTGLPPLAMAGPVQVQNAAGVLMVLQCLQDSMPVSDQAIDRGLQSAQLPGRLQIVPGAPQVVLDVAHNTAAAEVLKRHLNATAAGHKTVAVCAMLRDKPVQDMARLLADVIDRWFVAPLHDPRGARGEELQSLIALGIEPGGVERVLVCDSVVDAFVQARTAAGTAGRVVVFGSFHTVGDIIAHLNLPPV